MKISAKIDYACRALLELALHWPNEVPLQLNTIADRQRIPVKFLTQIFITLKQGGHVQSIRGKSGGYLLAIPPNQIKLSDVYLSFGSGDSLGVNAQLAGNEQVMDVIWDELNAEMMNSMEAINFETIIQRQQQNDKVMMFEI